MKYTYRIPWIFSNVYPGLLLAFLGGFILLASLGSDSGYVSHDSRAYFSMAEGMLEGRFPADSTWPLGYPLSLSLLMRLSGCSAFWASKILNLLLAAFLCWRIPRLLKVRLGLFVLLMPASLTLFASSLSEALFVVILLEAVTGVHRISVRSEIAWKSIAGCGLWMGLLCWVRYTGVYLFGVVLFFAAYQLYCGAQKCGKRLLWAFGVGGMLAVGLFIGNYWRTGQLTGGGRQLETTPWTTQLPGVFLSVVGELNPVAKEFPASAGLYATYFAVGLLLSGYVFIPSGKRCLLELRSRIRSKLPLSLPEWLIGVGVGYWTFMVLIRMRVVFDDLGYRLLYPGTVLVFMGLLMGFEKKSENSPSRRFGLYMLFFSGAFAQISVLIFKVWQKGL